MAREARRRSMRTNLRKQPMQERSKALVTALIRTTARILIRDGWPALTTNRVAREAGVSIGSLYQYFPDKDALARALVEQISAEMLESLMTLAVSLHDKSLRAGVGMIVHAAIDATRKDAALYRALLLELPRLGMLELFERVNGRLEDALADWLASRRDEVVMRDPSLAAHLIVTALDALTDRALLFRPELLESPRLARELEAMILGYLSDRGGVLRG